MTASSDSAVERRASGAALLATCISTLVVNANTSAVAILLPAISEDLDAPMSTLQWAVTGYMLVGAAFIVTVRPLGDVFGRRRTFVGGLILFIAPASSSRCPRVGSVLSSAERSRVRPARRSSLVA